MATMAFPEIQALSETELNRRLALAQGYVEAGVFHGQTLYHPPGQRTSVCRCPAYVGDWTDAMALVWHLRIDFWRVPCEDGALRYLLSTPFTHAQVAIQSPPWVDTQAACRRRIAELALHSFLGAAHHAVPAGGIDT